MVSFDQICLLKDGAAAAADYNAQWATENSVSQCWERNIPNWLQELVNIQRPFLVVN